MRLWFQTVLSIALFFSLSLQAGCNCTNEGATQPLAELLRENGEIVTFFFLMKKAGLEPLLKEKGPNTIFAPTDAAFAKLPPDKMAELEADKSKLLAVLRYHIIPQRFNRAWLQTVGDSKSLSGYDLTVIPQPLSVNGVPISRPHIPATNGAIHVIDQVFMPPEDVMDVMKARGKYTLFIQAIQKAELADRLRGIGPFTIFAPTDDAIKANPTFAAKLEDPTELRKMIGSHLGLSRNFTKGTKGGSVMLVESIDGGRLDIKGAGAVIYVNSAKMVEPDIAATNGVIHGIDSVIGPLKPAPVVIIPATPPVAAAPVADAKPLTKDQKRAKEKADEKAAEVKERADRNARDAKEKEEKEARNKSKEKKKKDEVSSN